MAASASRVRTEDGCIICRSQEHPIAFVCETCWDSQICTGCWNNLVTRGCQICRKKRRHAEFDAHSDGENASEPDENTVNESDDSN
jgi:hypothetical protein